MHTDEHINLSNEFPIALSLKAGDLLQVNTGCIWLTLQGHARDVWVRAEESWSLPLNARVWIGTDNGANFLVRRNTGLQKSANRPLNGWMAKLMWHVASKGLRASA